ncbi:MAG: hypothetical protein HC880_12230 [Bacteroidia bacterium]|nr:hypothetical protein [Bacteroidia bacterium]
MKKTLLKRIIRYFIQIVILLVVVLGLVTFMFTSPILYANLYQRPSTQPRVCIIGHRGGAGLAPENTLAAFRKALSYQVDRIELDVQQTRDGVIVVIHDSELARTTSGTGKVGELNYDQIRQFDAGSKFDAKYQSEKIPTLEEVISLINGQCELVIEIKYYPGYKSSTEDKILQLINTYQAQKWCILMSFDDEILERIHQRNPQIILHKAFFR